MKEIEIKIKIEDDSIVGRANLETIKEVNTYDVYFDNSYIDFGSEDKVIRLRKENDKAYIAFKGPREKHADFAVRTEIEPEISSFEEGMVILENLKLVPTAKVEKTRIYYKCPKYLGIEVVIDKYPFTGLFMEVEGQEDEIYAFLDEFGLDVKLGTKKNCSELFLEFLKDKNIEMVNPLLKFTFKDEEEFFK